MSGLLDPAQIAQFFAMPGATELVEAFAAIPPGPVRDSIVVHAQTLAQASAWIAAPQVAGWVKPATPAFKPQSPPDIAPRLAAASAEGRIIERALQGEAPKAIAADLGIDVEVVYRLQRKARKEGGVVFPGDDASGRSSDESKASPLMRKVRSMLPPPEPPYWWEDPASPIWDNAGLLPSHNTMRRAERSLAYTGPMSAQSHKVMAHAAAQAGLTLRAYVARRAEIIRRAQAGVVRRKIADGLRVPAHVVYDTLNAVGLTADVLEAAKRGEEARIVHGRDGRPGRMVRVSAYTIVQKDGTVKHMPAHERFRPYHNGQDA